MRLRVLCLWWAAGWAAAHAGEDANPRLAALDSFLAGYLKQTMPCEVSAVEVGTATVTIRGQVGPGISAPALAEVPMDRAADDPGRFEVLLPLGAAADGGFVVTVPRVRQRAGRDHDRLTSKWQVVGRGPDGGEPLVKSRARYAGAIACRAPDLPPARPKSKKGLGGWSADRQPSGELERLGIASVTVNVLVHGVVALEAGPGREPFTWQGRTYYANRNALRAHDATFLEAARHGAMVSVILLIPNPARGGDRVVKMLGHPAAGPEGNYAMPNVTDPDGLALYGAALHLMAERWSRPGGEHGRVHHWIVHNEVDAGKEWTNAGRQTELTYMDLYHRSLRLTDLIARQHDPNARAFISLTHHWTAASPDGFPPRRLLEILTDFTRAEGEFPWGIAYHPYPQSLLDPRCWKDGQATFSFDTAKITPRNLEVLDACVKQPWMRHRGTEVRPVHLSENGFHSADYSPQSLREQAAGMAWAWKKIQGLSSIEAWHYHNWIDNRHEGGLRIGLRKFADDPDDPLGPKPVWHLYQALGGAREEEACAPYLPVVGARAWEEILHKGQIR